MTESDTAFDVERYRQLLAEATDEPKRRALIDLLIEEKARDKLAVQALRIRLERMGLINKPKAD